MLMGRDSLMVFNYTGVCNFLIFDAAIYGSVLNRRSVWARSDPYKAERY